MTKIMESNYPESLRKIIIINAPKIFTMVFALFKAFMSQLTIDKIQVYGTDDAWRSALLEEVDADQLPPLYGGTRRGNGGNPFYVDELCMGGEVPKSYYLGKEKPAPKNYMEQATVQRRSKLKMEYNVVRANAFLKWEFLTEDGDLGFRVFYVNGDEKVDIIPWSRVDSHLVAEEGRIACIESAKYIVEFDNSFSIWKSKKLWYAIGLEATQGP